MTVLLVGSQGYRINAPLQNNSTYEDNLADIGISKTDVNLCETDNRAYLDEVSSWSERK